MLDESKINQDEADVMKIDTADRNSISFEPMSPDAEGKSQSEKREESPEQEAGADEEAQGSKLKAESEKEKESSEAGKQAEGAVEEEAGKPGSEEAGKQGGGGKKNRYQERINELTREKHEALRKAADLEARVATLEGKPAEGKGKEDTTNKPKASDFENYDDYIVALGEWSAAKTLEAREKASKESHAKETRTEAEISFQGRIETFKAEHEDFDALVFKPDLKISQTMVESIMDSEHAAEVLYYLGQHPDEAARIFPLSATAAARELGRIEERLGKNEPAPRKKVVSKAPEPIRPVEASGTVDKDPSKMSNEEYRRYRKEKKER